MSTRRRPREGTPNFENNWEIAVPRRLSGPRAVYSMPVNATNNLLQNYIIAPGGTNHYRIRRPHRASPAIYSKNTLFQLITRHNNVHRRRLRTVNNVNYYLTHTHPKTVLFRNVITRLPVYPLNVKKVRLIRQGVTMPRYGRRAAKKIAAQLIQRVYRRSRRGSR